MKNTGAILGWKFNHAPGICTCDGVITEWPAALGPVPTPEQIAAWGAEYEAALIVEKRQVEIATRLAAIDMESIRALRAKTLGKGSAKDDEKLGALEAEAETLRAEMKGIMT